MSKRRFITLVAILVALFTFAGSAALTARMHSMKRPPAGEFGMGPRNSARGLYIATLAPEETLKPRKMYDIRVSLTDAAGQPVDGATISIDGGMPQHGHGLPTKPRVTAADGPGSYEISGLRFNMGGWWELKLNVTTPAGTDTVTFNLSI